MRAYWKWTLLGPIAFAAGCGPSNGNRFSIESSDGGSVVAINGERFSFKEKARSEFQRSAACAPSPRVVVESFRGKIAVEAGKIDAVECAVEKHAAGETLAEAQEFLEDIDVQWTKDGDSFKLAIRNLAADTGGLLTPAPNSKEAIKRRHAPRSADVKLKVPAGANLEIVGQFGEIETRGIVGDVAAQSQSGAIAVREGAGAVRLVSNYGNINVNGKNGKIKIRSSSGAIEVVGAAGPFDVESGYGDVKLRGGAEKAVVKTTSGAILVSEQKGAVDLTSGYGAVAVEGAAAVRVVAQSGAVAVKGVSGPIDVKCGYGKVTIDAAPAGAHVQSTSGDIDVTKASGRLDLSTGYGGITAEVADAHVRFKSTSGHVKVKGTFVEAAHNLESGYGNVQLELPVDMHFKIVARTGYGKIVNDFAVMPAPKRDDQQIRGDVGANPVASFQLTTQSGNITLRAANL